MMPDNMPRLSFGSTSVASLVSAVRATLDPVIPVDWERVETRVGTQVEQLIEANRQFIQDAPSEQWLRASCVVLATYQVLKPHFEGPQLLSVFLKAMAAPFREGIAGYLESRFGIARDAPQEAFSRITENFQKRGEERFGASFRYATDIRDAKRNFVNIERCFFNDFFRANQAREVTSLFCALDKVWAEALEQRPYSVRFERPTTLANGDDACRFQFHRSDPA
jgi:hypothetical protein